MTNKKHSKLWSYPKNTFLLTNETKYIDTVSASLKCDLSSHRGTAAVPCASNSIHVTDQTWSTLPCAWDSDYSNYWKIDWVFANIGPCSPVSLMILSWKLLLIVTLCTHIYRMLFHFPCLWQRILTSNPYMARLCCFSFSTSCCSLHMCTWSTPYVYPSSLHPLIFSFPFIDRLRFTKVLVKSQLWIDHTQSMDELCFLLLLSVPVTLPTILFLPSSYISVFLIWCPTFHCSSWHWLFPIVPCGWGVRNCTLVVTVPVLSRQVTCNLQ